MCTDCNVRGEGGDMNMDMDMDMDMGGPWQVHGGRGRGHIHTHGWCGGSAEVIPCGRAPRYLSDLTLELESAWI